VPVTRILLVDDHPLFRSAVRGLLDSDAGLKVVGEAGTAAQALQALRLTRPSLALLDVSLPDQSGVELLPRLRAIRPQLPVLFVSAHPVSGFALPLLRAGAQGYISKQAAPAELLRAVLCVAAGERYLSAECRTLLCRTDAAPAAPHSLLSQRELQVFVRIARGLPPSATAAELKLSVKTIGTYRSRILDKLGLASNAEMAAYAVRNNLLDTVAH
jgi:DNA-binding NarL/FixJ family response regulator